MCTNTYDNIFYFYLANFFLHEFELSLFLLLVFSSAKLIASQLFTIIYVFFFALHLSLESSLSRKVVCEKKIERERKGIHWFTWWLRYFPTTFCGILWCDLSLFSLSLQFPFTFICLVAHIFLFIPFYFAYLLLYMSVPEWRLRALYKKIQRWMFLDSDDLSPF